jgi:uncharacterized membrane protein
MLALAAATLAGRAASIEHGAMVAPMVLVGTAFFMCVMLEATARACHQQLRVRKEPALLPEAVEQISRATQGFVRITETALAFSFSYGAVQGIGHRGGVPPSFALVTIGVTTLGIALGSQLLLNCVRELRMKGLDQGLEGWNGLIYRNPNDSRIWVPKMAGMGYTLNFAHGRAWAIMAALLVLPLLGVGFAIFGTR